MIISSRVFVSVVLAASASPAVFAQSSSPPPRFTSDVVVTATRTETDAAKAPVATDTVSGQELQIRRVQTLDQGLNLLTGVYSVRARGASESAARTTVRGFAGANRTLVLIDGQPMNDAYTGDVNWASLSIEDVERIEVSRGPASSLYGGAAMGGVINVLSRAIAARELIGRLQFGSFDTRNGGLRYADRWRRFGFSAGVDHLATDGYRSRVITASPGTLSAGVAATGAQRTMSTTGATVYEVGEGGAGGSRQNGASLKIDFTPGSGSYWTTRYFEQRATYEFGPYVSALRSASGETIDRGSALITDAGLIRQLSVTPGAFLQSPGTTRSRTTIVTGRQAAGDWLLQLSGSVTDQPRNFTVTPAAATATQSGGPGAISLRDSRTYSGSATVSRHSSTGVELTGGIDYRRDWSDNREYALTDWTQPDVRAAQTFQSHGKTAGVAAFAQARVPMGTRIVAAVGGRYDDWQTFEGLTDIFNAAVPRAEHPARAHRSFTGRVSLVAEPVSDWIIRGVVGTAFRNPTVFELYRTFRLSSGTVFYAAPGLQPERNTGIEGGVSRRVGSRVSVDAIYFRNQTSDLIYRKNDLATDPTGRTRVLVNAGEGVTNGLELSSRISVRPWLQWRAQYSLTQATIAKNPALPETEGKRVPFVPDHMVSVAGFVTRSRWTGAVTARYTSATYSLDTNGDTVKGVMGSYSATASVDASASYRASRAIEVFATMENLLDRRDFVFYLTPGRSISVGARIDVFRRAQP